MSDRKNETSEQAPERRHRTRAEERIAELDTSAAQSAARSGSDVDAMQRELEQLRQEAADNRAGWQRTAADFANFRRRTEHDREQMLGLANEALLSKLLAVADDFDRAIEHMPPDLRDVGWVEGIAAIDRKLRLLLDSEGLTPIDAVGQAFDPHQHEAVTQEVTSEVPEGTVTAELQRGYRIRERVLRPAMVAVAKAPDDSPNEKSSRTNGSTNSSAGNGGSRRN